MGASTPLDSTTRLHSTVGSVRDMTGSRTDDVDHYQRPRRARSRVEAGSTRRQPRPVVDGGSSHRCGPRALVGATDWCTRPPDLDVVRVRGTKNPDTAAIIALAPDLVIANQEENRELDVRRLRDAGVPVWVTRIRSVDEAFASIERLFDRAWAGTCPRGSRRSPGELWSDSPRPRAARGWRRPSGGIPGWSSAATPSGTTCSPGWAARTPSTTPVIAIRRSRSTRSTRWDWT